jgi:hypothetical protein
MGLRELEIRRSGGCGDSKNTTGLAGSACGNVKIIAVFGAAGIMVTTTVILINSQGKKCMAESTQRQAIALLHVYAPDLAASPFFLA